jgi:hypothetical protein
MSPTGTLLLGLVLGLRHATDPDHVVAMGTIVSRDSRIARAMATGVYWGIGHAATVLLVGVAMLVGGLHLPDGVVAACDLVVASMLVVLGGFALRQGASAPAVTASPSRTERALTSPLRPLLVGIVHGLAGSAATTLLAFATLRETRAAITYLVLFGAGTVVGMMGITLLLALSLRWLGARGKWIPAWLVKGAGLASILLGVGVAGRALAIV